MQMNFTICYYRDQNFGLNELAAVQDVRNEYNLQDITDEPPSLSTTTTSSSANDRGMVFCFFIYDSICTVIIINLIPN